MRTLASYLVIPLLIVGCGVADVSSPSPFSSLLESPDTSITPLASPPVSTSPATAEPTPGPTAVTSDECPSHSPLSVAEYLDAVEADPSCFSDGSDVTLVGWAGPWPDGVGWLAPGIEPGWLALSTAAIWPERCPRSLEGCGDHLSVHVDGQVSWKQDGRWLVVTGHIRDPRAATCRPDPPDSGITAQEAQAQCGRSFVLTSARRASAALQVGSFARVVIPELNVRTAPSTSAPPLQEGHADASPTNVMFGSASGLDDVYVLDGPVKADGFRWWRVARTEYVIDGTPGNWITLPEPRLDEDEEHTGWIADGDGSDAWLVPAENLCPRPPVETAEVTLKAASWAVRFGCFTGQTLTFRGWTDGGAAIFPDKRTWDDPENHDRLDLRLYPATLALPNPGQWVEVTGQFDHPSSMTCDSFEVLGCRSTFTVTQIVALGP